MKLVRFLAEGRERYGILGSGGEIAEIDGDVFCDFSESGRLFYLAEVKLLPPVDPGKVIAVAFNYLDHVVEQGKRNVPEEPVIFMVSPTAVVAHGEPVVLPYPHRVEYEAELVVVMGRRGRDIPEERALDYVLGFTCGNDISDRDLQQKDRQYTRAKSFHTFKPLGPWVATGLDPDDLRIQFRLNGEVRQSSSTARMLFGVRRLISFISGIMTLLPGDVIYTGTPAGVGPIRPGDVMEVEIEHIGVLKNPVVR